MAFPIPSPRRAASLLALVLATGAPAGAVPVVINNGLAPPNPENVIDAADDFSSDDVSVENVGCDFTVTVDCSSPGDPTVVAVVAGGAVFRMVARQTSAITMSGGAVGDLNAWDDATIEVTGGQIAADLDAFHSATITFSGGTIANDFEAADLAQLVMTGGVVQSSIAAGDMASILITGGSIAEEAFTQGSATMTIRGGTLAPLIVAQESSTIEIVGSGFEVDGDPVPFGPIASPDGILTGVLASGDPIDSQFLHDGSVAHSSPIPITGTIVLLPVPEPSAVLLLACGLVALAWREVQARGAERARRDSRRAA